MPLLRSRFIVLILAAAAVFVVLFYSSLVKETAPHPSISAESFNNVLQERINTKQQEYTVLAESYDEPLDELIRHQAVSFGVSVAIPESNWQKAEVSVLQAEPEQLIEWLSELAVVNGVRIQSLHLLSDSSQPFVIDHLVLVR